MLQISSSRSNDREQCGIEAMKLKGNQRTKFCIVVTNIETAIKTFPYCPFAEHNKTKCSPYGGHVLDEVSAVFARRQEAPRHGEVEVVTHAVLLAGGNINCLKSTIIF